MERPTKKQIIEYFKNAKTVRCLSDNCEYEIYLQNFIKKYKNRIYVDACREVEDGLYDQLMIWHSDKGYAKILTYKEKTFSITESQIKELIEKCPSSQCKEDYLKELFPEAFESEVKELKIGMWYISKNYLVNKQESNNCYGFQLFDGKWIENVSHELSAHKCGNYREATEQEVFESLKNEAVKRGFIYDSYSLTKDNYLHGDNGNRLENVFSNGIWENVPSITLSEAEQQLKKKIIVNK